MDGHAVVVRRLPGVPRPGGSLPGVPPSGVAPAGVLPPASFGTPADEQPAVPSKRMRRFRKLGRVVLNLVFFAMTACVMVMLGPALLGYHRYVILTGSMTGTYDRGSIVFDRPTPVSQLKVGDPITYNPPPGFTSQTRVTHRIWSIRRGPDGTRIYKTKGDANKHPDVWQFSLNQAMQDRVIFHIPEVGYLFVMLSLREFRLVLVGLPAVIIGLFMLRKLWKEGGAEARRQKLAELGWQAVPDSGSGAVLQPLEVVAIDQFPARVDLGLRPARAGSAHRRARPPRSRVDLSRPLRVGRLASVLVAGAQAVAGGSSIKPEQLAPGASLASVRLLVARRPTAPKLPATALS